MIKRTFDFLISLVAIILLSPVFVLITLLILLDSRGPILYIQKRVGRGIRDFDLYKFRTMKPNSDKKGLLTIGDKDQRITRIGYFLRKYKLDELPQLFNVLLGDMSLVGPRPEVRRYVELYTQDQLQVFNVKPGITDLASIRYSDENALLANQADPEHFYVNTILQDKLSLNLEYVRKHNFINDIKIILLTVRKIWQ